METKLNQRRFHGNLRTLSQFNGLIDFASNDYLGLARSKGLQSKIWHQAQNNSHLFGSTGSRLLTGNSVFAEALEEQIARFHGTESALLFSCGYMANLGLLSSLPQSKDLIFFDTAIHASMHTGIQLSAAQAFPFRHHDLDHLEHRLKHLTCPGKRWICIESLYSMDGTFAPLNEISELARQYDAHLIVDEAHAFGVFGDQGRGLISQDLPIFAKIVTFGKALGCQGAAVLGSTLLKNYLLNFASTVIYTTSLPLFALYAISLGYTQLPLLNEARSHLHKLIDLFEKTSSPIQIVKTKEAQKQAEHLKEHGFDVRAILPPTVRRGDDMLRIILHAFNTEEEVRRLKELL